jgi:subtilisin family serine protease
LLTIAVLLPTPVFADEPAAKAPDCAAAVAAVRKAVADGRIAWKITEMEDLQTVLGPPRGGSERGDGGMLIYQAEYPCALAVFGKSTEGTAPYTLMGLAVGPVPEAWDKDDLPPGTEMIDIGRGKPIAPRSVKDLAKFNDMWGLSGVVLSKLDLKTAAKTLGSMTFDTRTVWPPVERMPAGFDPAKIIEDGKDPGLGLRALHKLGIDGEGVHIAIIDQPHTPNHVEYRDQIEKYVEIDVAGVRPQMHGPPVASAAVGKSCGVAPAARLWFYAQPSWKRDNGTYCDALEQILAHNMQAKPADRIRVVSISDGAFPAQANYDRWLETMKLCRASGLLVITCAQVDILYRTAGREAGADPNSPHSYRPGKYGHGEKALLVPASNRTLASHWGPDVYTYWYDGGMSWAAPYLAGIAALGYQVNPDLTPQQVLDALRASAAITDAGLVVNPVGFIDVVRQKKGAEKKKPKAKSSKPKAKK